MREDICSAIKLRQRVKFQYHGKVRTVEPFCYGIHKETGNELLRAYQVVDASGSGGSTGWRLFRISDIVQLEITGQSFVASREGYNHQDPAMKTVYCSA